MKLSFPPDSTVDMHDDVRQLLDKRRATAGRLAFVEGATGRSLTWAAVASRGRVWQGMGDEFGGQRVGLLFADPLEMAAAVLGAISSGLAAVPLDPAAPTPELLRQVEQLGLVAVVTDGVGPPGRTTGLADRCNVWRSQPGGLDRVGTTRTGYDTMPAFGAALVLSSSGTTGTPKIIPLTERQLLHTARDVVEQHELTGDDCGYSPLPLFHINALVVGLFSTLVTGGRLVVDRRFSARSFWEVAGRYQVTWLNLVPAIITVLGGLAPPATEVGRRIGFARSASAPLAAAARERFETATGIGVLETYGMTEAASQIAANPRPARARRPGSVGRPVGLELRLVDPSGHSVSAGQVGEVQIRGVNVVDTYWAPAGCEPACRPATNADGWLATGDLGRLDAAGFLYLEGRVDDVINRGGEKVYPRQIEDVLLSDAGVQAAVVMGRAHPILGEEPVAFVLAADGCPDPDALVAQLQQRCATALSRFRRPAAITLAAHLPTGPTGKVRRTELRQSLARQAAS